MTKLQQHRDWNSRMILRGASAALMAITLALGLTATQLAQAQTFTTLYSFTGAPDGASPLAGLFRDAIGNLYGTTVVGGSLNCDEGYPPGCGVVFKVDTSGDETVLYTFTGGADGANPQLGLVGDIDGNLFGSTYEGGDLTCGNGRGGGVVFKVDTSGTETVLHAFTGGNRDGCNPSGRLLRDKSGNLYGTTTYCGARGYGTVFKIDPSGRETLLHSFGFSDGTYPAWTSVIMDDRGNFYGTAENGGGSGCNGGRGCGTVWRLNKNRSLTVLYSFAGGTTDGCYPLGIPIMDTKGNLYGTAEECGSHNVGIIWEVNQEGTETILHNFAGTGRGSNDGGFPTSGVIMDRDGNLYGTTPYGGTDNLGTVYRLNASGTLTLLHSFAGYPTDGDYPMGGLNRDVNGNFYGTTSEGGSEQCNNLGCGTVWKLTP